MLYRGSEIVREVAWVVFDEIHYMRDKGLHMIIRREVFADDRTSRTWCCVGGNSHPLAPHRPIRLPLRHNT
jgi:hypothetical protein